MEKIKKITYVFLSSVVIFLGFSPTFIHAASLYFSPSSGSYVSGGSIVVNVNVSSTDQSMNAVSGVVSFPQDKLQVVSLSKTGSVCNLWVQEPSFSNVYGTVNFECVVLNPGFTGSLGRVVTINFKSKASGSMVLNFSSGAVLANDGQGTDILKNSVSASFTVSNSVNQEPLPVNAAKPNDGTPTAPQISSPTHSNQLKWYSLNKAEFNWTLPKDATASKLFFDHFANSNPTISYVPPVNSKEISDIADGVYYFHAQTKNDRGWGPVSHFKFQIDTQNPDYLNISEIPRQDATNPKARFSFNSVDVLSGINYYEVRIDDTDTQIWQDDGTHIFQTHPMDPGNHTLLVKSIDRAGNFLISSVDFMVSSLPPVVITSYPKQLSIEDILTIKTKGDPNTKIILFLQKEGEEIIQYTAQSDRDGIAIFNIDGKFRSGSYKAWVLATNDQEAKSDSSKKVEILIKQPIFLKIGGVAISFLAILIPIVALVFLLLFLIFWMHHKFSLMRKNIKKEVREAETVLHKAFNLLKNNIREQIKLLEKTKNKRELTQEEDKILNKFNQDLSDAEKLVKKEIHDIEK